jgi:hypothetical protein
MDAKTGMEEALQSILDDYQLVYGAAPAEALMHQDDWLELIRLLRTEPFTKLPCPDVASLTLGTTRIRADQDVPRGYTIFGGEPGALRGWKLPL